MTFNYDNDPKGTFTTVIVIVIVIPVLRTGRAGLQRGVSPFGNPRITGCYAPPRGISSLRYVLHRLF